MTANQHKSSPSFYEIVSVYFLSVEQFAQISNLFLFSGYYDDREDFFFDSDSDDDLDNELLQNSDEGNGIMRIVYPLTAIWLQHYYRNQRFFLSSAILKRLCINENLKDTSISNLFCLFGSVKLTLC